MLREQPAGSDVEDETEGLVPRQLLHDLQLQRRLVSRQLTRPLISTRNTTPRYHTPCSLPGSVHTL